MKVISESKGGTRREVIIGGVTKHIHLKSGRWWKTKNPYDKSEFVEVKSSAKEAKD